MPLLRIIAVSKMITPSNRMLPILNITHLQQCNNIRFLSNNQSKQLKTIKKEKKEKFRTYVAESYMKYLQNYTSVIEKRFPAAMKMYRIFSIGIKEFYNDLKAYISLSIKINRDQSFSNISRQDIELYHKMPADMWRIAPVLILSAIPFGNYVIFPLAFLKPRKLLCSHFWSTQQRSEFSILELQERQKHNTPVIKALKSKISAIPNDHVKLTWMNIIAILNNGDALTSKDVLQCKKLFEEKPFSLENINYQHAGHLLKLHGLSAIIFRLKKLRYRALILCEMDKAILREGGVGSMSVESLTKACQIRGLNSSNLKKQDMVCWLKQWLIVSQVVDKKSYSLLLHCPIFFQKN